MNPARDLATLFERDLIRLRQELEAFPDEETLWQVLPGVTNSAGNLALHLEGNLREFIGRELGAIGYQRNRPEEFSARNIPTKELLSRIEAIGKTIPGVIASLSEEKLSEEYPLKVFKKEMSVLQFLMSLYAHLSWHLGQIDYLRRIATQGSAIELASF